MKIETEPGGISPVFRIALEALEKAALSARKRAVACNTDLIIWQNNRVVRLSPAKIREERAEYQKLKND